MDSSCRRIDVLARIPEIPITIIVKVHISFWDAMKLWLAKLPFIGENLRKDLKNQLRLSISRVEEEKGGNLAQ